MDCRLHEKVAWERKDMRGQSGGHKGSSLLRSTRNSVPDVHTGQDLEVVWSLSFVFEEFRMGMRWVRVIEAEAHSFRRLF